MRWKLTDMLFLITAVALVLVIFTRFDRTVLAVGVHVRFGVYLALLAIATSLIAGSPPRMKRFCLTYAVFGWGYLLFELLIGTLFMDDVYEWNRYLGDPTWIGILFGFATAFTSLLLPGSIDSSKGADNQVDEKFDG